MFVIFLVITGIGKQLLVIFLCFLKIHTGKKNHLAKEANKVKRKSYKGRALKYKVLVSSRKYKEDIYLFPEKNRK